MDNGNIDTILAEYREAAIRSAELSTVDPLQSNRWARKGRDCYWALRKSAEGKQQLTALMYDTNPYVRGVAAADSLAWDPELARVVLIELRDSNGPGSFEAKWTLKEFDAGNLKFD